VNALLADALFGALAAAVVCVAWRAARTPFAPEPDRTIPEAVLADRLARLEAPEAIALVRTIEARIAELAPVAARRAELYETFVLLRTTAARYLPETLDAYLALPHEARDVPGPDDRATPRELLAEQLHVIAEGLAAIALDVSQSDRGRLAENGAFLRDRFASYYARATVANGAFAPKANDA
jgi:hypothetical protein